MIFHYTISINTDSLFSATFANLFVKSKILATKKIKKVHLVKLHTIVCNFY